MRMAGRAKQIDVDRMEMWIIRWVVSHAVRSSWAKTLKFHFHTVVALLTNKRGVYLPSSPKLDQTRG
jgi:hypothetical protein